MCVNVINHNGIMNHVQSCNHCVKHLSALNQKVNVKENQML